MNIEQIKKQVNEIKEFSGDDEAAHSLEDSLYLEFITYIATEKSCPDNIRQMATEVLKTRDLEFLRWCA